jgi:hypothetical protein
MLYCLDVKALRFIFEFQRKCQGTETEDIDNIDVQYGPLN